MNERTTTLEKIGPTVDDAVSAGLLELGLAAEMVDVEVLDTGSRGLLGIGGRQARVRLSVKTLARMEPVPSQPAQEVAPGGEDELLRVSRETVKELLNQMRITATVTAHYGEPDETREAPVLVDVSGNDLGVLIGRRAEILNAMQYIVNLIVSKQVEHWVQVLVDVEGYRARRERQLRQMAQRMADQAIKTGHRQSLEPMPASERRIIHLELREHSGVTTQSVGEEPARKVTIVPK